MAAPYQRHQKRRFQQQKLSFDLSVLLGKPFWIWNKQEHRQRAAASNGNCCFNHVVGLPQKDKREYPMFDYEKLLYDELMESSEESTQRSFKNKHLWVKKATGLGVTEFMLRMIAWLCTKDGHFANAQICIVTGPNKDLAIKLIKRLKNIFERRLGLTFSDKETVLELNGCSIEAYPSNHLDSFRSLTNPKFIFLDEADMFRKGEQEEVRHVSERYIGKSDPYIVMVSTPDRPGGLFYNIENRKIPVFTKD
jgi:late competence protein required for DNA uptake (superfamily II DNA/RNA helicase)